MAIILLVEDDLALHGMLTVVLHRAGYHVRTAVHGYAAIEQLQQPVDLILCDVEMPGLDGIAFYHGLRADPAYHTLPFIFMSTRPLRHASTDRHMTVLRKPLDPHTLLTTMTQLITTRRS